MFSRSRCVAVVVVVFAAVACLLRSSARKAPPSSSFSWLTRETILFLSLSFPIHHNSAGAAATLRPAARPFLLAGVFKSEEGEEQAAGAAAAAGASAPHSTSTSGAGADSSSTSTSASDSKDGVAAAAAAVRSLTPGATLGSVSDAAVSSSALWPGKNEHDNDGNEDEDEEEEEEEEDELNEWLARHTVDFLDAASLLQSALSHQFCTVESCPAMRAGPRHEYLWAEPDIPGGGGEGKNGEAPSTSSAAPAAPPPKKNPNPKRKKQPPSRLPAREYASALFSWADALLACPQAFPQARGEPFPPGFRSEVLRPLYRRLCRVFAHFYFAHWKEVSDPRILGAAAHLNTVFKHYVAFGREHGLLPEGELDPVRQLVEALLPPPRMEEGAKGETGTGKPLLLSLPSSSKAGAAAAGRRVEVSASSAAAAAAVA